MLDVIWISQKKNLYEHLFMYGRSSAGSYWLPFKICYPCHKLIMKNEEYIYNMAMQFFTSLHIIHNKVIYSKVSKKISIDLFKTSISWYHLTHFQLL